MIVAGDDARQHEVLDGLTAIVSSASICSVMRIVPSSVAMPAPARAATTIDVNTGASSRVTRDAERRADEAFGAELAQRRGQLQREDHADEQRRSSTTIKQRLHADVVHRLDEHADAERPLEQPDAATRPKQHDVLPTCSTSARRRAPRARR